MSESADSIGLAIAIFDKSASRTTPNQQTEAWAILRAELIRLSALERQSAERIAELEEHAASCDRLLIFEQDRNEKAEVALAEIAREQSATNATEAADRFQRIAREALTQHQQGDGGNG